MNQIWPKISKSQNFSSMLTEIKFKYRYSYRKKFDIFPKTKMNLVVFDRGSICVSASAYSNEVI